ncbi:MAG: hypothetical protein ACO29P_02575, partial [Bacteroidia bacterium]
MILGSTKLIAQPAFQFPPPDVYQATVNQPPKSHRIEQWELLEEDFTMGIINNDAQADHLREYDSVVVGRGWIPVNYTPAINDLYCPHPPPSDCSENCGIYPAACHHKRLTACNERCKSVEWRTWTYRAALFESAAAAQQEEHHFLQIKQWEGAYIEVYINGKLVKEVNPLVSSFAEVTIDLDGLIKKDGKDSVYIQFASPSQLGALYSERSGMVFPADNEASITMFGSYGLGKEGKPAAKASP